MSRFAPALRRLARELDVPRTVRTAILLEMAADLEAAYEHHRRSGSGEEEAARRAEAEVLGSSEVIRRLGRLHRESWRGWSEEVGSRLTRGGDLLILFVAVAPLLVMAAVVAGRSLLGGGGGFLVWTLGLVGVALVGVVASGARRLARGDPARPPALRLLLLLSAVAPAIGLLAVTRGLRTTALAVSGGEPGAVVQTVVVAAIVRDGATLLLGLLLGIAGVLGWFILLHRSVVRAARDVDALLQEANPPAAAPRARGIIPLARRSS